MGLKSVTSAKPYTLAAKPLLLQSDMPVLQDFEGERQTLDCMRIMLTSRVGWPRLFLEPHDGGFALFLEGRNTPRVWLIAERSKRVRIFKSLETALSVCKAVGADRVIVLLDETAAVAQVQEVNL